MLPEAFTPITKDGRVPKILLNYFLNFEAIGIRVGVHLTKTLQRGGNRIGDLNGCIIFDKSLHPEPPLR